MSEYWKSVPRKFCDFCKCWITDNKPSVEFHERGKRHKENVELRLKEIRKKSLQNSILGDEMKAEMDKMEKAALEAFKKDLKENPELAAQYGVSLEPKPQTKTESKDIVTDKGDSKREWYEAVSPEGHHYYWSTVTGESKWEAPDDFVSLQEQEAAPDEDSSEAVAETSDTIEVPAPLKGHEVSGTVHEDLRHGRSAYGAWQVIKETEQPTIFDETSTPPVPDDIPLPADTQTQEGSLKRKEPKFKEKVATSLGSISGDGTFKKRKVQPGARNIRQKDSND